MTLAKNSNGLRSMLDTVSFQRWVEKNVKTISYRTVVNFMRYSERCDKAGVLIETPKSAISAVLNSEAIETIEETPEVPDDPQEDPDPNFRHKLTKKQAWIQVRLASTDEDRDWKW